MPSLPPSLENAPPLPTIIYIAAKGHSGSTLLELLLSSHSQLMGVGELKKLSPYGKRDRTLHTCTCGVRSLECPFWTAVFDHIQQNGGPSPLELNVYSSDPTTFADHNQRVYRAIASVSGKRYVVDSSKDHLRLSRLLAANFVVRPILLRRGSHGVVYSNVRQGRNWLREALEQTVGTLRSGVVTQRHNPIRVRYEHLVAAPAETLDAIMTWLGLRFEPAQIDWTRHEHHQFAGNSMRFSTDPRIVLDRAWVDGLTPFQKVAIAAIEAPLALPASWWGPLLDAWKATAQLARRISG